MKKLAMLLPSVFLVPVLVSAAVIDPSPVQQIFGNIRTIVDNVIIPFIFTLALVVFLWGMFKTFILGGSDEAAQEKGKSLMMYAIAGFVLMVSIWGLVRIGADILGADNRQPPPLPSTSFGGSQPR